MRTITLSDHSGDTLAKARAAHDAASARAEEAYLRNVAGHERSLTVARRERDEERARLRPLSWLRRSLALRRLWRSPPLPAANGRT